MKYFTTDLAFSQSKSEFERDEIDKQWRENMNNYWERFDKDSKKMPKNLVKVIKSNLHDSMIESISFVKDYTKKRLRFNVLVNIKNDDYDGILIHYDVSEFNSTISSLENYDDAGDYLYGEFLREPSGIWTHNFLFFYGNEIFIKCKKIEWISN